MLQQLPQFQAHIAVGATPCCLSVAHFCNACTRTLHFPRKARGWLVLAGYLALSVFLVKPQGGGSGHNVQLVYSSGQVRRGSALVRRAGSSRSCCSARDKRDGGPRGPPHCRRRGPGARRANITAGPRSGGPGRERGSSRVAASLQAFACGCAVCSTAIGRRILGARRGSPSVDALVWSPRRCLSGRCGGRAQPRRGVGTPWVRGGVGEGGGAFERSGGAAGRGRCFTTCRPELDRRRCRCVSRRRRRRHCPPPATSSRVGGRGRRATAGQLVPSPRCKGAARRRRSSSSTTCRGPRRSICTTGESLPPAPAEPTPPSPPLFDTAAACD